MIKLTTAVSLLMCAGIVQANRLNCHFYNVTNENKTHLTSATFDFNPEMTQIIGNSRPPYTTKHSAHGQLNFLYIKRGPLDVKLRYDNNLKTFTLDYSNGFNPSYNNQVINEIECVKEAPDNTETNADKDQG